MVYLNSTTLNFIILTLTGLAKYYPLVLAVNFFIEKKRSILQIITILLTSLIMSNQINTIKMDSFDLEAILLEDQARQPGTPERYAYTFDVDINLFDLADIQILDNGDKIWKFSIQSDNAIGMKFYFNSMK